MKLYLLVTADEYELPLVVCDSAGELAELLGRQRGDIYSTITRKRVSRDKYNGFYYRIIKVDIDEEDEHG